MDLGNVFIYVKGVFWKKLLFKRPRIELRFFEWTFLTKIDVKMENTNLILRTRYMVLKPLFYLRIDQCFLLSKESVTHVRYKDLHM